MTWAPPGYDEVCRYWFTEADGTRLFAKVRYELRDTIAGPRKKTFLYWDPDARRYKKPPYADAYLYRLHEVTAAVVASRSIHWAEGEKDADALAAAGVVATSHHQGAGHVTLDQAGLLSEAESVVLWVDKDVDHWEVGAYDACLRYNLLIDAGVPASRISIVKARGVRNKDAADHLASGFTIAQALTVDPLRLAEVARTYTPSSAHRAGYRRG